MQMLESTWLHDLGALVISILAVISYWFFITGRMGWFSPLSIPSENRRLRHSWVAALGHIEGADILAVQTLRNALMVASILASTTVLILIGLLTMSAHQDQVMAALATVLPISTVPPSVLAAKLFILILLELVVFFCLLTTIRYYGHSSFMVSIPVEKRRISGQRDMLITYLSRAGDWYSLGQRLFLFSVPLFSWLFGPIVLLLTTVAMIGVMYVTDRISGSARSESPNLGQ
jgi:uncharacterized membrane protein